MNLSGAQYGKSAPQYWENITYTTFSQCAFEKPQNLIKPIENQLFRVTENQCQKPYKTNDILALFPPKSEKGLQKH